MTSSPLFRAGALALGSVAALALAGCHDIHLEARSSKGGIGIYDDLFAVSAPDAHTVVAGGYYGAIYRSTDGGETWSRGATNTQRSIYDVSMATADAGWAVGQSGLLLRTTDGGATWAPQKTVKEDEGAQLFGVHAIDANTAWVVGEWGTRLFTDDGGSSWKDFSLTIDEKHPQFVWLSPPDQARVRNGEKVYEDVSLNDVYCAPAPSTRCWIAGEFGYVFHSNTRGQQWERGTIVGDIKPEPVMVGHNETDISVEAAEKLRDFAKRIEAEAHLNVEIEPMASPREIAEFGKPSDPTTLFEILEARKAAVRAVVEEAGILSDRIRERGTPPWDYEDYLKEDPSFLQRYLDARTADQPMIQVRVAQNPYLFSVRFDDEQTGYITALGGLFLHTSDGGQSWSYTRATRHQALFSIGLAKSRQVAVGEKGFIQVSTDQGKTWAAPKTGFPPIFLFMRDVRFAEDRTVGYIVGQGGMVLRTADGAETWTQVLPKVETVAENEHE